MSHRPTRYTLLATIAELEAMVGPFNDGDQAVISDGITGFARTYTYGSKVVASNGLTILTGPGGTAWHLNGGVGSYSLKFIVGGGTIAIDSASDPSIDGVTATVVKNGTGDYTITFNAGSVIRPDATAVTVASVVATPNGAAHASASAEIGVNTVRVRMNSVGLDGAVSTAADYDVSLVVSMA